MADLDGEAARAKVRAQIPGADPQDLLLLDDLLGIADPEVPLPQIDPDARRRRLTALINAASLARTAPALFIIEDAHWIDAVSESMLADFLTVIPRTPLMVLITARPEYDGALTRVQGAQTISLAPLGDSDTAALMGELLGADPSLDELTAIIAERAAGTHLSPRRWCASSWPAGIDRRTRWRLRHRYRREVSMPATSRRPSRRASTG